MKVTSFKHSDIENIHWWTCVDCDRHCDVSRTLQNTPSDMVIVHDRVYWPHHILGQIVNIHVYIVSAILAYCQPVNDI